MQCGAPTSGDPVKSAAAAPWAVFMINHFVDSKTRSATGHTGTSKHIITHTQVEDNTISLVRDSKGLL